MSETIVGWDNDTQVSLSSAWEDFRRMKIGYARCSLADDRQTLDHQIDALIAVGVDPRHIFQDRASGARDDRPGLKACLEFLKRGDQLVSVRLDRIGRSLPHLLKTVEDLRERGVILVSLGESIDTSSASGELTANLFMSLAQYERSLLKERVVQGVRAAQRRGRFGGRPRRMSQDAVDAARGLLAQGMAVAAVARALGVPRTTLIDSLSRSISDRQVQAA